MYAQAFEATAFKVTKWHPLKLVLGEKGNFLDTRVIADMITNPCVQREIVPSTGKNKNTPKAGKKTFYI